MDVSCDLSELDKTSGREFEEFIIKIFEKLGYFSTVTNRSKEYGSDIMLQQSDFRIAVQTTRSNSELNFTSVQRVLAYSRKYSSDLSAVITNNKFLNSAKNLAKTKNVILIDRKKLLELIEFSNLPVTQRKDFVEFCNHIQNNTVKEEIDKKSLEFLGLNSQKTDHSLLTKNSFGRPIPLNNKKEKLFQIFKEIRGDNDTSVNEDILLDFMEKYPLLFGNKSESEIFLQIMINQFVVFKPKDNYYNLV
ncbi:MAG: restriction endonuclease [Nitrosopumilus sp.]|nr:MAG: restriction endonuclease [Candidatus Nitrosomarinus sp.]